jgi:hypothetical protein
MFNTVLMKPKIQRVNLKNKKNINELVTLPNQKVDFIEPNKVIQTMKEVETIKKSYGTKCFCCFNI